MKLVKRTEVELRDSLHEAIDRMSLIEIVVLIFLVQMIRTREFVSHILPRPRKMLPAPEGEYEIDWDEVGRGYKECAEAVNTCTDLEPQTETELSYAEYIRALSNDIRNSKPYPIMPNFMRDYRPPTESEWNRLHAEAPPYFSVSIPMPMRTYTRDAYGRPRVADIQPGESYLDGGVRVNRNAVNYLGEMSGYCTPSRNSITGYNPDRCN